MPFNPLDHPVCLAAPRYVTASAWNRHVPAALLQIELLRPRVVVELGASDGVALAAFCQAATALRLDTRCLASASALPEQARAYLSGAYGDRMILAPTPLTPDDAALAMDAIDLLHMADLGDADAAQAALDAWLPHMSERGALLLDGAQRLRDELARRYPRQVALDLGGGLSLVVIGAEMPAEQRALAELPAEEWDTLRDLLSALGERATRRAEAEELASELRRERGQIAAQSLLLEGQRREMTETQRRLDNALWQMAWLDHSRGVRMVKLARASRALLRQRGPLWLAKRVALWTLGRRGYYRLDSAAAQPAPKLPRPAAREFKQIMFLSGCPGGAMRYRCDHQAEQLNLLGCSTESAAVSTVNLMELLDRFQCFALHRVAYDTDMQTFIAEARQRGKPLFFETDDLVFAPESADNARRQAELERFSPQERALYLDEMARIRQTAEMCDAATVSTEPLQAWVAALCPRVAVTPNVVSQEMVIRSRMALAEAPELRAAAGAEGGAAPDEVVIAYLSGSPSHDRDFLEAQDAVLWALETYPHVRLLVGGPLTLSDQFDRFGARVRREPLRPWQTLPALYASVDINLAPLERDNPFTAAKSGIKFLEAALLEVPTIATPLPDFTRVMRDGENGLLAATPDDWRAALRRLIESPAERRRLGEAAHADTLRLYTTRAQAPLVFEALRAHYRAIDPADPARRLRVNWVVEADGAQRPPTLRLARALAERGHSVRVCLALPAGAEGADGAPPPAWAAEAAPAEVMIVASDGALPAAEASTATSRATAALVAQQHESLCRVLLTAAPAADQIDQADADEDEALPLRRLCLEPDVVPDAEAERLEGALREWVW